MASKTSRAVWIIVGTTLVLVLVILTGSLFSPSDSSGPASAMLRGRASGSVAVVPIEGPIFNARPVIKQLHARSEDKSIKALVVRVDSPGGGVVPSQEIYNKIRRIREGGKPVVVSFGSTAASGGYYVASAADWIVSNPGTITGSIGVLIETAKFHKLLAKIGVESVVIKNSKGTFKDILNPARDMTGEEERLLKSLLDSTFDQFVDAIVEGRKMDRAEVLAVADGRIFTGVQAAAAGLVDQVGDLDAAIAKAGELAKLGPDPHVIYPRRPKPTIFNLFPDQDDEWSGPDETPFLGKLLGRQIAQHLEFNGLLFYLMPR
ncbi:MAG: signal peptide peptidase SppA [Deltaproteobacteria bacterium]|nr:signal peptide peptidase SppA [Deltaproteobacteria bacterium]